jgi:glycosyltransferase involved in cell wall biosynthesis
MSGPLRVGLNLLYLNPRAAGAGTYAHELVPALLAVEPAVRMTAFVGREVPGSFTGAPWASELEWVRLPVTVTHGPPGNFVVNCAAHWGVIPWVAARRRLDVVHGLANIVPLVQPGAATVVTVLDLIWMHVPDTMSRRATLSLKALALPSARRADRVIAISRATRDDLVATLGLDGGRIDVTPLGVGTGGRVAPTGEGVLRERLGLGDGRVVLCVAQKRRHKNLDGLIRAVAGLEDAGVVLVLVGSPTPHEQQLRELAGGLGVAGRVRFVEWLEEADLEGLYALASCFVLPSFLEGFGLPVLEAMRRGVPVACSDASSLPEVAGDAALLFDPGDVGAMREAVGRVLGDRELAAGLVARGRERCRTLTWEATARATLASYHRAIEQRSAVPRWRRARDGHRGIPR